MDSQRSALNFAPFAAGIIAGANGTIVGHPFDTLKTRFQVGKVLANSKMNISFVRQLYRGILPPLMTSGAIQSVNFFLFENFRTWLRDTKGETNRPLIKGDIMSIFVVGTMSGSVISMVSNPISMVKIRQQIVADQSVRQCIRDIYASQGIAGFYRGYKVMYLLDASRGLYLAIYEVMKRAIADTARYAENYIQTISPIQIEAPIPLTTEPFPIHTSTIHSTINTTTNTITTMSTNSNTSTKLFTPNSTSTRMLAAAITGVISWIIIFPIDVVRVRLHLDFNRVQYTNWKDCVIKTYAENGIKSFFRGISYTLIRAGPVSAASLTTYEYSKDIFERWESV